MVLKNPLPSVSVPDKRYLQNNGLQTLPVCHSDFRVPLPDEDQLFPVPEAQNG